MTVKFGYGSPDKVRDVATILRPAEAAEAVEAAGPRDVRRRSPGPEQALSDRRPRTGRRRGAAHLDRLERSEVARRDRSPGRRLDPRPRRGLAERALSLVPPDHRGGRALGRPQALRRPTIYNLPGAITATPACRTRDAGGRWIGGSPAQWIEELTDAILNHDAAGFTLFPTGPDGYEVQLSRWSQEIVPALRTVISQPAEVR